MGFVPQEQRMPAVHVHRAASAAWLAGFLTVLGIVVIVSGWGHGPRHHVAALCVGAGCAVLGHALYWRPRLETHEHGVVLVNPLRTVEIPWARIVDVRTRFTVTVVTDTGSHSCFALPAAGPGAALRADPQSVTRTHPLARAHGSVRTGDLTSTRSGAAAHDVRTQWQRRVESGELDVFARDDAAVPPVRVRWVPWPLTASIVLLATGLALYSL